MTRAKHALVALIVALIGCWGCARSTTPAAHHHDRLKVLEAKNTKLEEDFRAAAATRDQLRKKLAAAEGQQRQLRAERDRQVQALTQERDDLRRDIALRTSERDAMGLQYEQFRKSIRELLGQAEAAVQPAADRPTVTADAADLPGES